MNPADNKRSVVVGRLKTSVNLEEPFWLEVKRIAADRRQSVGDLILSLGGARRGKNLSSQLRLLVLSELKAQLAQRAAAAPLQPVSEFSP